METPWVSNVVARSGTSSVFFQTYAGTPLSTTLRHNTLVGSSTGHGVYVGSGYVTIALVNNIIAGHAWGIPNTVPASSSVLADHTLFWANGQTGIEGTNPLYKDPAFVDADGGYYHVGPGSAAIDAAVDTGENHYLDGDLRPIGSAPDIGADEAWRRTALPVVLRELQARNRFRAGADHPIPREERRPSDVAMPGLEGARTAEAAQ